MFTLPGTFLELTLLGKNGVIDLEVRLSSLSQSFQLLLVLEELAFATRGLNRDIKLKNSTGKSCLTDIQNIFYKDWILCLGMSSLTWGFSRLIKESNLANWHKQSWKLLENPVICLRPKHSTIWEEVVTFPESWLMTPVPDLSGSVKIVALI